MSIEVKELKRLKDTPKNKYEYKPEDFKGMNGLDEELKQFYIALEEYKSNSTLENKISLLTQRENLYFGIKHRHLEGFFNEMKREVLLEYLGGLLDD